MKKIKISQSDLAELFAVGGEVTGAYPDVQKALVKRQIELAIAEDKAANNGLVKGLTTLSQLTALAGNIFGATGTSQAPDIAEKSSSTISKEAQALIDSTNNLNTNPPINARVNTLKYNNQDILDSFSFATGGEVPVEVEGGEIVQEPGQEPVEVQGPSHEQGGVPVNLEEGAEVFSKRVTGPDGVPMVDRKKKREKKIEELKKLLLKDPFNKTLEDSVMRSMASIAKEEDNDVQYMQAIREMLQAQQESMEQAAPPMASGGILEKGKNLLNNKLLPNVGNMLLGYGKLSQVTEQQKLTEEMRAADTPNINPYEDVGKYTEELFSKKEQQLRSAYDMQLEEINKTVANQKTLARNTARGLNALRALNLFAEGQGDLQRDKVASNFLTNLNQLLASQAQTRTAEAELKGKGKLIQLEADKADKDAYYTAKSQNLAGAGRALQEIGKDFNAIRRNAVEENLVNNMYSKYGIRFDSDGNPVDKYGNRVAITVTKK